jgi:hypothetical protein
MSRILSNSDRKFILKIKSQEPLDLTKCSPHVYLLQSKGYEELKDVSIENTDSIKILIDKETAKSVTQIKLKVTLDIPDEDFDNKNRHVEYEVCSTLM